MCILRLLATSEQEHYVPYLNSFVLTDFVLTVGTEELMRRQDDVSLVCRLVKFHGILNEHLLFSPSLIFHILSVINCSFYFMILLSL